MKSYVVQFRPLVIPADVNDADAADFREMVRVRNQVYRTISGHDDNSLEPGELLPHYAPNNYETRYLWVAVVDEQIVGRVGVDIPLEPGSVVANWMIELLEEFWGGGIGSAAYELVEQTARSHGRTVLQSWAEHPHSAGEQIASPTGFGQVPHDHAARFFARHGYSLSQVDRVSVLDLVSNTARLDQLFSEARAASAGYRLVTWVVPTPPEMVDGYAWMKSRMSTDAPAADLEFDEEVWDAARVAAADAKAVDGGRLRQVVAAQHIESGELVAFNELEIGADRSRATDQQDTLVLTEHRGHRLGMLVKCAALIAWRDVAPLSPRVVTYNAEENRPMLDINEAIGFVPIAYEGGWKKTLPAAT